MIRRTRPLLASLLLALSMMLAAPSSSRASTPDAHTKPLYDALVARGIAPRDSLVLRVDLVKQEAKLYSMNGVLRTYPISASKFGIGNKAGSNMTPTGWHVVRERIGAGAAMGTSFVSRADTGRVVPPAEWRAPDPAEDLVLTRVMWLAGLEDGVNRGKKDIDSHARCIYLHGTNQEQLLGQPASHGCIRFSNADIVQLFDFTEGETLYCYLANGDL